LAAVAVVGRKHLFFADKWSIGAERVKSAWAPHLSATRWRRSCNCPPCPSIPDCSTWFHPVSAQQVNLVAAEKEMGGGGASNFDVQRLMIVLQFCGQTSLVRGTRIIRWVEVEWGCKSGDARWGKWQGREGGGGDRHDRAPPRYHSTNYVKGNHAVSVVCRDFRFDLL
jgi:hypothetical protein